MVEVTAREKLYRVIFGTDTVAGQRFDIALIYLIVLSVLAIIFDSIESVHNQFGHWLFRLEWLFTLMFTVEYFLRIYSSPKRLSYIFSFYGLVDLLAILPTYLPRFNKAFTGMRFNDVNILVIQHVLYVLERNSLTISQITTTEDSFLQDKCFYKHWEISIL